MKKKTYQEELLAAYFSVLDQTISNDWFSMKKEQEGIQASPLFPKQFAE